MRPKLAVDGEDFRWGRGIMKFYTAKIYSNMKSQAKPSRFLQIAYHMDNIRHTRVRFDDTHQYIGHWDDSCLSWFVELGIDITFLSSLNYENNKATRVLRSRVRENTLNGA